VYKATSLVDRQELHIEGQIGVGRDSEQQLRKILWRNNWIHVEATIQVITVQRVHVRQRIQHWCTMFTTTSVQQTLNEMVCYMQSTKHGNYEHLKCLLEFFNMRVYHPGQSFMQACLGKQALVLFWVSSQALGYFII